MKAECGAGFCISNEEMREIDGKMYFPKGWRVIAHRLAARNSVALCPYHLRLQLEWETRFLHRVTVKQGRDVKNVP
jgi:hypothetical protein